MAKKVLTTGKFTFNSVAYDVTNLRFERSANEVDVTDTGTTGSGREFLGGRVESTFSIDVWKNVQAADLPFNTEYAAEIDFEGFKYSGNAIILRKTTEAAIDDAVKQTYEGRFNGTVTETPAP